MKTAHLTRRQSLIVDAIAKLRALNQRSGAPQVARATGIKREAVRRECTALIAAGRLIAIDLGSTQAGVDYAIPSETP